MQRTSILQLIQFEHPYTHFSFLPSLLLWYRSWQYQIVPDCPRLYFRCRQIATHCRTLPYIAIHCRTLPYIVVHCHTLSNIAVHLGLHVSSLLWLCLDWLSCLYGLFYPFYCLQLDLVCVNKSFKGWWWFAFSYSIHRIAVSIDPFNFSYLMSFVWLA